MANYFEVVEYKNGNKKRKSLPQIDGLIKLGRWFDTTLYTVKVLDIRSLDWNGIGDLCVNMEIGTPLEYPNMENHSKGVHETIYIDIGTKLKVGQTIYIEGKGYQLLAINGMKWVKDCNGVNVDIQVEEIILVTE